METQDVWYLLAWKAKVTMDLFVGLRIECKIAFEGTMEGKECVLRMDEEEDLLMRGWVSVLTEMTFFRV